MNETTGQRPAVFLDRDGTICEEVGYLDHPDKLRLIEGAAYAIHQLNAAGFYVFVTTNQSGVARGYFPEAMVNQVHARLDELLAAQNARIDAYFYCPHLPNAPVEAYRLDCSCRKPRIGMITQAAAQFSLELSRSFVVGDKLSDCKFGRNARLRAILVRTGYGREEEAKLASASSICVPDVILDDLSQAVEWILGCVGGNRRGVADQSSC